MFNSCFSKILILRYTCQPVDVCENNSTKKADLIRKNKYFVFWNTTVSDNCCLHCNNTVYKADTVIGTTRLEDRCESEETHVCRKIPGIHIMTEIWVRFLSYLILPCCIKGLQKAKIETQFSYGLCCNDDEGLTYIKDPNTAKLQPSTCSERRCIKPDLSPSAFWASYPVCSGDF